MDFRRLHGLPQAAGDQEIVDSPSDVAGAGVGEAAPPTVMAVTLLEEAKRIDEAGVDEVLEALALLVGEALLAAVRLWIGEIELRVRNVEIAAEDDRLLLLELLAVGEESGVPMLVPQREAAEVVFGVWRIDGDDVELREFRSDDPAFLAAIALELIGELEAPGERLRKAVDDRERLLLREDRRPGIALLDGRISILVIIGQVDLDLAPLGLGLLQTEDVRLVCLDEALQEPFADDGARAVDVP